MRIRRSDKLQPSALALVVACAFAFVPASASTAATNEVDGALLVNWWGVPSKDSPTSIFVSSEQAIAKVRLSVPAGYRVKVGLRPGSAIGWAQAAMQDMAGTFLGYAYGDLVVEDPARNATDPAAQACAPGVHAAVWRVSLSGLGQTFELPIFVDRPDVGGASRAVLRFCPIWRMPDGAGVSPDVLELHVETVFGALKTRGRNAWRAFITPALATLAPDESRTFEVRALEPIPHEVTLHARYVDKSRTAVLRGKVTAAGEPEPGAEVWFFATRRSGRALGSPFAGPTFTNSAGEYSLRLRLHETTAFFPIVSVPPHRCTRPSSAPAGCLNETASATRGDGFTIVRVRRPTDPRLAVRVRDQAFARRIVLRRGDLPAGWTGGESFSLLACPAFKPRLSRLTATGHHDGWTFVRSGAEASSRATVYASEAQASTAFGREARIAAARCIAGELRRDGYDVQRIRELPLAWLGDETRAYRIVLPRRDVDLMSFRVGRAVVHLGFDSVAFRTEVKAAKKVAARVRRG